MVTPIFIIESSVVSGMLVRRNADNTTEILYSCGFSLPFQEALDLARLELSILSALDKTAEELAHKGLVQIGKVSLEAAVIVVSAPWFVSENKNIVTSTRQPFRVKDSIVNDLVMQEIVRFEKEQEHGADAVVLERKVTDVRLNGYSTNLFQDKKASKLEFSLYVSTTSKEFKHKFEDTIHKYFSRGTPSWHTMPIALFASLLMTVPERPSFMIIEIGGEITEIIVVKNNLLMDTISFPYGSNSFLRSATTALHATTEINASLYKQYGENTLNPEARTKVDESLVVLKNEWGTALGKALHQVSGGLLLPKSVYVKSESDFQAIFKNSIEGEGFAQTALAEAAFEVFPIDHTKLISIFINSFVEKRK